MFCTLFVAAKSLGTFTNKIFTDVLLCCCAHTELHNTALTVHFIEHIVEELAFSLMLSRRQADTVVSSVEDAVELR